MIAASLLNGHHLFKRQVCSSEIFHKYNMNFIKAHLPKN